MLEIPIYRLNIFPRMIWKVRMPRSACVLMQVPAMSSPQQPVFQDTMNIEKPQNGLAGLKYWRNDIVAGLLVSLVSLPFSLGIAIASGAPPLAGLTSAIIAGLIYPFLG